MSRVRSLARKYQHLFPQDDRYPSRMFGFGVGDGWHDFLKELLEDLDAVGFEGPILQVKEKFGGLRFYTYTNKFAEELLVDNAERQSFKICERCGMKHPTYSKMVGWRGCQKPWGRDESVSYVRDDRGWILTLCNYCYVSEKYL